MLLINPIAEISGNLVKKNRFYILSNMKIFLQAKLKIDSLQCKRSAYFLQNSRHHTLIIGLLDLQFLKQQMYFS